MLLAYRLTGSSAFLNKAGEAEYTNRPRKAGSIGPTYNAKTRSLRRGSGFSHIGCGGQIRTGDLQVMRTHYGFRRPRNQILAARFVVWTIPSSVSFE